MEHAAEFSVVGESTVFIGSDCDDIMALTEEGVN